MLKAKQIHAHVGDPPRKLLTKDKIEPLGFQKVGPKSGQLGVTGFECFVVQFEMKKCLSQLVLLHPEG
jgi:hypothetical protein